MAGSRAREKCANGANRLAVAPDDSTDVALAHLQSKDGQAALRDFREHDFVWEFDQLPDDEFEKLSHAPQPSDVLKNCLLSGAVDQGCSRGSA